MSLLITTVLCLIEVVVFAEQLLLPLLLVTLELATFLVASFQWSE